MVSLDFKVQFTLKNIFHKGNAISPLTNMTAIARARTQELSRGTLKLIGQHSIPVKIYDTRTAWKSFNSKHFKS